MLPSQEQEKTTEKENKHEHFTCSAPLASSPHVLMQTTSTQPVVDIDFKRQVLTKLNLILAKLSTYDDHFELLEKNMGEKKDTNDENEILEVLLNMLPVDTDEKLEELENFLSSKKKQTLLSKEMSRIGGATVKEITKKIMYRIISNEFGQLYSWEGGKEKRKFINLVITKVIFAYGLCGKKIKMECPSYCECDTFILLKRATCVDKTIVVIQLDLPSLTQILDISHNQISQLDENIFHKTNLLQLKFLNISHNKLSQINVFAFDGLEELLYLDLSHNTIQYILPNWFDSMKKLENLYLRGNNFGDTLNVHKYVFKSKSLKVLDLSKSYISYLTPNIFKLPNLEYMDLTENQLFSLSPKIIFHLRNLRTLKITNNTFSCNKATNALRRLIKQRGIQYEDPCSQRTIKKFEKVMVETTTVQKNLWIVDEDQKEMCHNNSPQKSPEGSFNKANNSLICISEFPYILIIISVLLYGLLIGFICGSGVKSCRMKHTIRNYRAKNSVRLKHMKTLDEEIQLSLDVGLIGQSTPISIRKGND